MYTITDTSYKQATAEVVGDLTATAVGTGSQLVAYSGFSPYRFITEPYNADLDFGTGEWSVGAWVNVPVTLPVGSFPVSANLISNSTFDTADGWTLPASGMSISDGALNISTPWTLYGSASISLGTTYPAGVYLLSFNKTLVSSGNAAAGAFRVYLGSNIVYGWANIQTETINVFVSATTSFNAASIIVGDNSGVTHSFKIDNFEVRQVTSAALVADRAHPSGAKLHLGITSTGLLTATAYDGTTTRTVITSAAYNTATWLKAEATYKAGKLAILVNGQEVASTNGAPLLTLNNSSAVLTIGNSYTLDAPFPGSIALAKLSATVPTAEQALWMYEQEKQLFRDGAQCVLPDSNNIQDLAYDDVTGNWVAISTTNRTEWSGLVRTKSTAYTETLSKVFNSKNYIMTTAGTNTYITTPGINHREMVIAKNEAGRTVARPTANFEFDTISFTANTTTSSNVLASVGSIVGTPYIGMGITGSGIPAGTTIIGINGTTYYMSANATATASTVAITQNDYLLPVGYTAVKVMSAGNLKREGSAKDYTRLFDGFRETIRFGTSPGSDVRVQIQCISNKY